ncbi:hypothetical protein ACH47Z_04080 [Streptomyces sp. NPDC020192]|uniref:hypothetical protein n=1 Tax=Streptomyces sp. NPDC020192 TaxID=3365066 RepID=UPI0037A445BE
MPKSVRLGIIRARHDTTVPVIPDPACIAMLMTGDHALLRFWEETTRGYLDFVDSTMFPWVDMTIGADTSRGAQARAAVDALRARFPNPPEWPGLNGLIVVTHPGRRTMPNPKAGQPGQPATVTQTFDGGSSGVDGLPVAVLPVMSSDLTFMCHEVGHGLGLDHTFGLDNNGTDWDPTDATIIVGQEYGSPYDLMSSATFAALFLGPGPFYSGQPTFTGPTVTDWPYAGAYGMGPHLARANLHLFMPDALAGRVAEASFPQPGAPVTARIVPASASNGTCLLALHPPGEPANGVGRVYVEYRVPAGWDAGMDPLGPSLSREGVVVHSIVDVANKGPRAWYRGSVPTESPDTDVAVAMTPLVVRAVAVDPERQWVDLSVTAGAAKAVEIVRGLQTDDVVGPVGEVQETTTPCGDTVRRGTFATSTTARLGVRSTGFGGSGEPVDPQPSIAWTVGGVPLSAPSGNVGVQADGTAFTLDYTIDPVMFELTLTSRGGERYETPAVVTVSGDGTTASATAVFTAQGWVEGIDPDDAQKFGDCLLRITQRFRRMPAPFRRPTPEPPWSDLATRRLAEEAWLRQAFRLIAEPPDLDATGRGALSRLLQVQAPPTAFIDALGEAAVDYSVPEADLTDWLRNPGFTPYPAFAQSLLLRLDSTRLKRPVFLDVIAFNYENSPGKPSPRLLEDVDTAVLEAAVVEGWNVRYGETASEFGELLA